jgi:DNA gyrase subunit A
VRDESDRDGIRLVIELKKDVMPQVVVNQLYRMTDLQTSFGVINLAIHHGRPASSTSRRRSPRSSSTAATSSPAARASSSAGRGAARDHRRPGRGDHRRRSRREDHPRVADPTIARAALMKLPLQGLEKFVRARRPPAERDRRGEEEDAVLPLRAAGQGHPRDAPLAPHRASSREARAEYGELCDTIARLRAILADEKLLFDVIVMELEEIRAKYADKRRTEIVANEAEISDEDLIQEEDMVVTISHAGYIKRTSPAADYRAQKRGGKGKIGMEAREEDWVTQLFVASTHAYVFFFSDKGKVYVKKVYEIPLAPRTARGARS